MLRASGASVAGTLDRSWHLLVAGLLVACSNDYDSILASGSAGPGVGGAGPASVGTGGDAPASVGSGAATGTGGATQGPGGFGGVPGTGGEGGNPPQPFCGDGIKNGTDQCDAGLVGNEYCSDTCKVICDCPAAICDGSDTHAFLSDEDWHCYYLSQTDADQGHLTRDEAEDWCVTAWGGHLASLETEAEWAKLLDTLPSSNPGEFMWLSARESDDFAWPGGLPFTLQSHWRSGEPNQGPNDCLAIASNGELVDHGCNEDWVHHICERAPAGE